jgi:hypothetical protein
MSNLQWRGVYDLEAVYLPGDVVTYPDDGFTYVCVKKTRGVPPYLDGSGFELLSSYTNISTIDGGEF